MPPSIFGAGAGPISKGHLPKPMEGRRKIVYKVESLQNSLMRLMPNDGVGLLGEIEHLL